MLVRPCLCQITLMRPSANMYRVSVWTWARPNDDVDARVLLHAATAVVIIAVFALAGAVPIASMHALAGCRCARP